VNHIAAEGFRDVARRLRLLRLLAAGVKTRRALAAAETELGWLGWEQVEIYDEDLQAEVAKIREFEDAQASLLNVSAQASGRKAGLDAELEKARGRHDAEIARLEASRAPVAEELARAETRLRQRREAVQRFEQALSELATHEKELMARSVAFMQIAEPTIGIRTEAREVSDALGRLAGERKIVTADKVRAAAEAAELELGIRKLRSQLAEIDGAMAAARDQFAATGRRIAGEKRQLDRKQRKSDTHMTRLDREKRTPYQKIGACLADLEIPPLNQPQIMEKVLGLRARREALATEAAELREACAAAPQNALAMFYFTLVILAIVVLAGAAHFMHR
jgi:chromosome segregation ATPase